MLMSASQKLAKLQFLCWLNQKIQLSYNNFLIHRNCCSWHTFFNWRKRCW